MNVKTEVMPPVVVTKAGVSLAEHLKLSELPLATTPGGKNFAMKALHPSEHTIKTARIPGSNVPSVAICSDQVVTINVTNANSSAQILQTPNIMVPCVVSVKDGGVTHYYNFNNACFGGAVEVDQTAASLGSFWAVLKTRFEKYTVVAQSVTCELIAPALSDQGTVTAAQYQSAPWTGSVASTTGTTLEKKSDVWAYSDLLPASTWVLGTAAYTGKARDGYYQPLKLSKFRWRSVDDPVYIFDNLSNTPNASMTITDPLEFPYYSNRTAATALGYCDPSFKPTCDSVGVGQFDGIAAATALRVRVRQVIEVTGIPGSFYAPMFEAPLPPDETSLRMYKEISARMADAYPASYNDLGKLRDIIYKIGKKVLPFAEPVLDMVSMVPGPVGTVAGLAKGIVPMASGLVEKEKVRRKAKKAQLKAPAPQQPLRK